VSQAGGGTTTGPSDLVRALRTYLDHLVVERGLAPNSISSYRRDLRRYLGHLDAAGITSLDDVTEQVVSGFLMALREGDAEHQPLSASSAGRTVVAVRGFHKFALKDGLATHDPSAAVRPPTPAKRLPKAVPLADVERLLEAAPHYGIDIAGRMAELGRQPRRFARLVRDHPDQVLFGTDIFPATEEQFRLHFRFVETADESFGYDPGSEVPGQGRWNVSGLDLAPELLPGVYRDNARRFLGL